MNGNLLLRVFDVEHGACAILTHASGDRIAMVDCGHNATTGWRPSTYLRLGLQRNRLDYLFITNADQDHVSDLEGFWEQSVHVATLYRNWSPDASILRQIKGNAGQLTDDMKRYLAMHASYVGPVAIPFDAGMNGATCSVFCNSYPQFDDTNNLSLAAFFTYGTFKILFPGDLENDGWQALLQNPAFVTELRATTILVASHHGRSNGFCDDIFQYFVPNAVVISDKPIAHETQEIVPDYRDVVRPEGIIVAGQSRRRHVLTTRKDGDILFTVLPNGDYRVETAAG